MKVKEPSRTVVWQEGKHIERGKVIYNNDIYKIGNLFYESLEAYFREALDYPQNLFVPNSEVYLITDDEDGESTIWTRDRDCDECEADKLAENTLAMKEKCDCVTEWPVSYELVNVVWLV
jgi:hypothetical protein